MPQQDCSCFMCNTSCKNSLPSSKLHVHWTMWLVGMGKMQPLLHSVRKPWLHHNSFNHVRAHAQNFTIHRSYLVTTHHEDYTKYQLIPVCCSNSTGTPLIVNCRITNGIQSCTRILMQFHSLLIAFCTSLVSAVTSINSITTSPTQQTLIALDTLTSLDFSSAAADHIALHVPLLITQASDSSCQQNTLPLNTPKPTQHLSLTISPVNTHIIMPLNRNVNQYIVHCFVHTLTTKVGWSKSVDDIDNTHVFI